MKVLVIGSGLIGVTTAYFLQRQGHEVTVIDRQQGPGRETSFANGGLLTPSMAQPWNAPGSWRVLLGSLGRLDAPLQLRLSALPALAGWGVEFLRNSRADRFECNTLRNVRLALHSLAAMEFLRRETGIEYGRSARGSLRVFRDATTLEQAASAARGLAAEGLTFRKLSTAEAIDLEPALKPLASRMSGALHYEADEAGDAYRFCTALADHVRERGVDFRFGIEVLSLRTSADRVTAVTSEREQFVADRYVVAAGSYSRSLLRLVRIDVPVRPAKGYSVTFADSPERPSLRIPVVDDQLHAVIVPFDGAIRAAGTAEFVGYDLSLPPMRIANLVGLVKQVLPEAQLDAARGRSWCGLRAMSADGVPIIGQTMVGDLFVNIGHGHLGWTMAAGSAQLLSDLMSGRAPSIDPTAYALARFSAAI